MALAVVGIALSRSQGCGMAELPVTTEHTFLTVLAATWCDGGSTTVLFGPASADAQNASARTTLTHRTGRPHRRLNVLPVFMAQL